MTIFTNDKIKEGEFNIDNIFFNNGKISDEVTPPTRCPVHFSKLMKEARKKAFKEMMAKPFPPSRDDTKFEINSRLRSISA